VASLVRYDATACQVARLPVRIRPGLPQAFGDFYFQAFDRLVTLPAAGYDYDIDWTPMSAGLAPAGMTASFAALARTSHIAFFTRDGDMRDWRPRISRS